MKSNKSKGKNKMEDNVNFYDVFVPGGFPTYTYISRDSRQLQKKVSTASENLTKLMVITGSTKSGKTVLVNKVYPQGENVWIDGGTVSTEEMFWETVVERLDGYTESNLGYSENTQMSMAFSSSISGGIRVLNLGGELESSGSSNNESSCTRARRISNKVKAIEILNKEKKALVIDDFHYISKAIQKNIVRALKAPIMNGVPVICIAIPSRKYDAVNVEREMTGRIEEVSMPEWSFDELKSIACQGFETLNAEIPESIVDKFAEEAQGSPFLMQEFCKSFCKKNSIEQKSAKKVVVAEQSLDSIFEEIADNSGRPMFKKLENGPRSRTDRKERTLKGGTKTDIYGLVLAALKEMRATGTIKYDQLRTAIKNISADEPPQRGEVSRILEKIAEISYSDSSSTPVIDWQKEDDMLTITDPFFAFFLRWTKS